MKNKFSLLIFSFVLMFLIGSFERVFACSCLANTSACQQYSFADTIFVGKVVNIRKEGEDKNPNWYKEFTTFEVEDLISGTKAKQLVVHNRAGTSCDISFLQGDKYLIFADGDSKSGFKTGYCSGNLPLADAEKMIAELKALPKAGTGGKIFGSVSESLRKREQEYAPMAGIELKIQRIDGKRKTYKVTTDAEGNYELIVPQGKYKVNLFVPSYADLDMFDEDPVFVKDRACTAKSFNLFNKSKIVGKVIDSEGKSVENINVELLSIDEEPGFLNGDGSYSDENGEFLIENLPVGRYTLSVNFTIQPNKERPFPPTYYPNASSRENATIIEVGLGQSINNLIFRLPPRIPIQKIYGIIVLPDGRPAAGMTVNLLSEDAEWSYDRAVTDENGNFVLNGFISKKYCFSVEYYGQDNGMRNYELKKDVFTLDKDTPSFRLVLQKQTESRENRE